MEFKFSDEELKKIQLMIKREIAKTLSDFSQMNWDILTELERKEFKDGN